MIKRRKILLFLCLIISVLNVSVVKAEVDKAINVSTEGGSSGNGGSGSSGNGNPQVNEYYEGNKLIRYRYNVSYNTDLNYRIRSDSPNGDTIKSGTWMGINVEETQTATWAVSNIVYSEVKKIYTCTKRIQYEYCPPYQVYAGISARGKPIYKTIHSWESGYDRSHCTPLPSTTEQLVEEKEYKESFSCQSGWTLSNTKDKEEDIDEVASKNTEIFGAARSSAESMIGAPLSILQITTDELNSNNKYRTITIRGTTVSRSTGPVAATGTATVTYSYKPSNICINLKTGKVKYNEECKLDEEAKINPYYANGTSYWQYFSPLNMKSGSNFSLIIKNNTARLLSGGECHSMMDNYKNQYQNYIISQNGTTLNGDYCKNGNCNNLNKGNGSDWQVVSNGCYFSTVENFDVVQKYYFEEMKNNELKFNGYNLYYRPININNPFPTTPTENSIWYEWFNSTNKTPNLKDSFNEITYSVAVPNKLADTIRAYNVNNPYPSFDKLSLNGTSSFLQSIGVESLTKDKINKLGEGTKTCIKNGTVSIGSDCS